MPDSGILKHVWLDGKSGLLALCRTPILRRPNYGFSPLSHCRRDAEYLFQSTPNVGNLNFTSDNLKRIVTLPFLVVLCAISIFVAPDLSGQNISFARPDVELPITIQADSDSRWHSGIYEVLHLRGNVQITQGSLKASSQEAIVWVEVPADDVDIDSPESAFRVIVYLEQDATIDRAGNSSRIADDSILERLFTRSTVALKTSTKESADKNSPIYQRAFDRLQANLNSMSVGWPRSDTSRLQQTQFEERNPILVSPLTGETMRAPASLPAPSSVPSVMETQMQDNSPFSAPFQSSQDSNSQQGISVPMPMADAFSQASGPGSRDRVGEVGRRDSTSPVNLTSRINPDNANERYSIAEGGIRIVIESDEINRLAPFQGDRTSRLTILADNIVQWTTELPDGSSVREMYLDGNVVFAKDGRTIEAQQMYYNVDARQGTILDAEVLTKVPGYAGKVKLKADVLQQLDENNMQAIGAAFTTSRLGFPRYWLQSEALSLTREPTPLFDEQTGAQLFDQTTGQPEVGDDYFVQAEANRIYAGGLPVFYWPKFKTNLSDPGSYVRRFRIGNDQIFGFQLGTGWDMYKLLGRRKPKGTDWIGILDYLSDRGLGFGTEFSYKRNGLFGIAGPVDGVYKSWFINDDGTDFLGRQRGNLVPEKEFRGRSVGRHRHEFGPGNVLRAELGYISDRNFLEQYYEREWDTAKDATTGIWLERNIGTQSFNLTADYQLNDFFTQTSWLPRVDHFMIGQPLFGDRVVWHNHTSAGYGRIRVAETPTDATDASQFDPLAWEANATGVRFNSRHELDFPVQLGPTKVVPYVMGELGYWQEDVNGDDALRGVGQVGVRGSLPLWKVNPEIQSTLWNVNGLAHKVSFDFNAFVADASQDLDRFPLYDPLDDDAQEHFRRRFLFNTFGLGAGDDVPLQYDERYYALRSGLQSNVTSPSAEIADDLAVIKLGARQRWQTRRGAPGKQRIVDWITLDAKVSLFPNADRDNFGADAGMFDYDFRWHLGDRVTLLSDGFADFFSQGLRTVSVGAYAERPEVGSVYLGVRSIEGPISSNIISASAVYRLSDTWGVKGGAQVDFGETGTIGNRLGVVYIGESFLWEVGFNYDASRDNLGIRFGFEPRFIGGGRIFRPGGVPIQAASSRWLE
ncbi:LPS-assembly protein LptD [Mariniblastus fucicola]|uniref:LPS-assembly protein LptD n=1 Tax=Mariniblastus fucicola TaxID=980251 RepID=A0A5B9PG59_9BACT|nr:hypothetical protein [Mariniblastus fucicola]QEG24205.1 hypothetical protein MFFC18_41220 [Mariniblastus fucicola]